MADSEYFRDSIRFEFGFSIATAKIRFGVKYSDVYRNSIGMIPLHTGEREDSFAARNPSTTTLREAEWVCLADTFAVSRREVVTFSRERQRTKSAAPMIS